MDLVNIDGVFLLSALSDHKSNFSFKVKLVFNFNYSYTANTML